MNSTTKILIVSFMDWFTRLNVTKYGEVITPSANAVYVQRKIIPVPITWASKDKWAQIINSNSARRAMDPEIRERNPAEFQWTLPRIGVNLTGISYDSARKLTKLQKINDSQFIPTPFNFEIELSVVSRTLDDNLQIMEQILPYFSPDMSITAKTFPGLEPESIPIVLNSISPDIPVDTMETDERLVTYTYNFTIKGNLYLKKKYSNRQPLLSSSTSGSNVICINSSVADRNIGIGTLVSGLCVPEKTTITSILNSTPTGSCFEVSNPVTCDISHPLTYSGDGVISSFDVTGVNGIKGTNFITIPLPMLEKIKIGMLIWGEGIPEGTYIIGINPDGTLILSKYLILDIILGFLYFAFNSSILNIKTNIITNKEYVQIDQNWLEHLQKIETKFNEFQNNGQFINPLY